MAPTVSVALCTFNGAPFIGEQVAGILDQEHPPDEVVLADDGSSDGTVDLVRQRFAASPPAPRLVLLEPSSAPLGVTANFERAVRATTGDLIALCDQDDRWRGDRLERVVREFESDPDLLLQHSDARLIGEDGAALGVNLLTALSPTQRERRLIDAGAPFEAYIRRNLVTGATIVFRRSLLDAALPFPAEWVHDEWLAIIAAAIGRVQFIDETLIDYRQHGSNAIGVAKPTFRYRLARLFEPRGARYQTLASRSQVLVQRLDALGARRAILDIAESKARFEAIRSTYPRFRGSRIAPVWRGYRSGSYARLSSQGDLDVIRDLVQPA